jgi:hypothetical protein
MGGTDPLIPLLNVQTALEKQIAAGDTSPDTQAHLDIVKQRIAVLNTKLGSQVVPVLDANGNPTGQYTTIQPDLGAKMKSADASLMNANTNQGQLAVNQAKQQLQERIAASTDANEKQRLQLQQDALNLRDREITANTTYNDARIRIMDKQLDAHIADGRYKTVGNQLIDTQAPGGPAAVFTSSTPQGDAFLQLLNTRAQWVKADEDAVAAGQPATHTKDLYDLNQRIGKLRTIMGSSTQVSPDGTIIMTTGPAGQLETKANRDEMLQTATYYKNMADDLANLLQASDKDPTILGTFGAARKVGGKVKGVLQDLAGYGVNVNKFVQAGKDLAKGLPADIQKSDFLDPSLTGTLEVFENSLAIGLAKTRQEKGRALADIYADAKKDVQLTPWTEGSATVAARLRFIASQFRRSQYQAEQEAGRVGAAGGALDVGSREGGEQTSLPGNDQGLNDFAHSMGIDVTRPPDDQGDEENQ